MNGWPNVAVFIPQPRRMQLKPKGIAPLVDSVRGVRLWPAQLAEHARGSVVLAADARHGGVVVDHPRRLAGTTPMA